MIIFIFRRILQMIPTMLGVLLLVFWMFFYVNSPHDMAKQALGEKASSPEQVLDWICAHHYDMPVFFNEKEHYPERKITNTIFFTRFNALIQGDLGKSDVSNEKIGPEISRRILPSLELMLPIFLLSFLINVGLAMFSAWKRGEFSDKWSQIFCVVLMSISTLIVIIAGQFLFGRVMRLVPISGFATHGSNIRFLLLPVLVGVVTSLGSGVRLYRTFFLEEINKDYVRTARAKGLSENRVLFVHVLKNAMIPILTNLPVQLMTLFTGNMLLENFFSIPGLGGYTVNAVINQDFSVVLTMVIIGSFMYMLGLLLSDICYMLVDPRIRIK